MSIEKLIKFLLLEKKSIIIPGIGELATLYHPAKQNNTSQTISPPSQSIIFRNNITRDFNEVLVHAIVRYKKMSQEEARDLLYQYIKNFKNLVEKKEYVQINDLGHFFLNDHNQIDFKDQGHDNLFFETFGMEPVKYTAKREPHQAYKQNTNDNINKMASKKSPPEKNNLKKFKIWGPIIVSVIIIVLIIIFYNQHEVKRIEDVSFYPTEQPDKKIKKSDTKKTDRQKKTGESNVENKKSNENTNIQSEEYIAQQLKEKAKKENALKLQAQMDQKDTIEDLSQNKYYLVAGSFNEYQNAQEYKIKLEKKGYEAKILDDIKNNNNYYRVYIGSAFANKKIAMDKLNQLRQKENDDFAWLLSK